MFKIINHVTEASVTNSTVLQDTYYTTFSCACVRLMLYLFSGQYLQNRCNVTDITCQTCIKRLPSCISLSDGNHAFPNRLWKQDFIICYKNRTVDITKCTKGYFNPNQKNCTENVIRRKLFACQNKTYIVTTKQARV